MKNIKIINTIKAPAAIGAYSQAVKVGDLVFLSGQIGLAPNSMELVSNAFKEQAVQVFENLTAVSKASGGSLKNIVKLTVYLTDLNDFSTLNEVMEKCISAPYPARATVEVKALPKNALIEIDAILHLS